MQYEDKKWESKTGQTLQRENFQSVNLCNSMGRRNREAGLIFSNLRGQVKDEQILGRLSDHTPWKPLDSTDWNRSKATGKDVKENVQCYYYKFNVNNTSVCVKSYFLVLISFYLIFSNNHPFLSLNSYLLLWIEYSLKY